MSDPLFPDDVQSRLNEDPPPGAIQERGDGFSYLETSYVIKKANQIFGPGGWSYRVVDLWELYRDGGDAHVCARVRVHVTAFGADVTRGDVGASENSQGDAQKGAVSDGIKRCMRTFGPAFGNSLYASHTTESAQNNRSRSGSGGGGGGSTNKGRIDNQQAKAIRNLSGADSDEEIVKWINQQGPESWGQIEALGDLSHDQAAQVIKTLQNS